MDSQNVTETPPPTSLDWRSLSQESVSQIAALRAGLPHPTAPAEGTSPKRGHMVQVLLG